MDVGASLKLSAVEFCTCRQWSVLVRFASSSFCKKKKKQLTQISKRDCASQNNPARNVENDDCVNSEQIIIHDEFIITSLGALRIKGDQRVAAAKKAVGDGVSVRACAIFAALIYYMRSRLV